MAKLNQVHRTLPTEQVRRRDPRLMSENDHIVVTVNRAHDGLKAGHVQRLSRKHVREVQKAMPYLRECKRVGTKPRRVSKRVLATVQKLRLV